MKTPMRKTPITEAYKLLREAQKAYMDNRFFVAKDLYEKAMKLLENE